MNMMMRRRSVSCESHRQALARRDLGSFTLREPS